MGQKNLFGGGDEDEPAQKQVANVSLPDVPDWSHSQKLAFEKEVFGFYLTSHPLSENADQIRRFATHSVKDLGTVDEKAEIMLGGMVSSIKKATTKKPSRNGHSRYVNFDFETPEGIVRCIMWPEDYAKHGETVKAECVGYVRGRVDRRGREPNVVVNKLYTLDDATNEFTTKVAIKFERGLHTEDDMLRVREVLGSHSGQIEVAVIVESADEHNPSLRRRFELALPANLRVTCSSKLRAALQGILGEEHVRFHAAPPKKHGRPAAPRRSAISVG
jgi:DNA polymerase-3 subunit alpha